MNQRKRKSAIVIRRLVGRKMKIWKESVVDNRIEVVVGGETLRSKSRYPRVVLRNAQLRNFRADTVDRYAWSRNSLIIMRRIVSRASEIGKEINDDEDDKSYLITFRHYVKKNSSLN